TKRDAASPRARCCSTSAKMMNGRPAEATVLLSVEEITIGSVVTVRHGEVLPLDGDLLSERALSDESSLTGEPYVLEKVPGDEVRSGTVNQGPTNSNAVALTASGVAATWRKEGPHAPQELWNAGYLAHTGPRQCQPQ